MQGCVSFQGYQGLHGIAGAESEVFFAEVHIALTKQKASLAEMLLTPLLLMGQAMRYLENSKNRDSPASPVLPFHSLVFLVRQYTT